MRPLPLLAAIAVFAILALRPCTLGRAAGVAGVPVGLRLALRWARAALIPQSGAERP